MSWINSLGLQDVLYFENNTLDMSKYTGDEPINQLIFIRCGFTKIENLSVRYTKNQLIKLHLQKMFIDEISRSIFTFENSIQSLMFQDVVINNLDHRFLYPLADSLTNLYMQWLPGNHSMNDIFNYSPHIIWKIDNLLIRSYSPKFQRLSAQNFSHLSNLRQVFLSNCGIEIIDENTFHSIAEQLFHVDLSENHFKYIDPNIIYELIDTKNKKQKTFLNILINIANCDCKMLEVIATSNVVMNSVHNTFDSFLQYFCGRFENAKLLYRSICNGVDVLRNHCTRNLNTNDFLFPHFDLKINDTNILIIKTTEKRVFRLWIHNLLDVSEWRANFIFTNQRCPFQVYKKKYISCYRFDSSKVMLNLKHIIKQIGYIQICVHYISIGPKTMWPLHCITRNYHQNSSNNSSVINVLVVIVIISAIFGGLCLSIIIFKLITNVVYKRKMYSKRNQNCQTKCFSVNNEYFCMN